MISAKRTRKDPCPLALAPLCALCKYSELSSGSSELGMVASELPEHRTAVANASSERPQIRCAYNFVVELLGSVASYLKSLAILAWAGSDASAAKTCYHTSSCAILYDSLRLNPGRAGLSYLVTSQPMVAGAETQIYHTANCAILSNSVRHQRGQKLFMYRSEPKHDCHGLKPHRKCQQRNRRE